MSDIFQARVRDLSHKGLGVVNHPDGRVFFVRGVWPGDQGRFVTSPESKSYTEIKCLEIIQPSEERVEVICPHRGIQEGKCGGCPWMIASYQAQLRYKEKRILHNLKKRRIEFKDEIFLPIIPSDKIYSYRNRAQLKTDGKILGYVSEGTNIIAPIEDCLILEDRPRNLLKNILNKLPKHDFEPAEGFNWNFIEIDDELKIEDLKLNSRLPFKQGNSSQNQKMKTWLREKLSEYPNHFPVVDLFCGSGNFTEVLTELNFSNILAVEVQGIALKKLEDKKLKGVRILPLDMTSKGAWSQISKLQPHAKLLIIDPPRAGIEKRRGLFKYLDNLEAILYISCEPETYARDLYDFIEHGWKLTELQPLDLFPHTPHVEIMAVLKK